MNPRLKYRNSDNSFPATQGIVLNRVPSIRMYYYEATAPVVPFDLYPVNNSYDVHKTSGLYWQNGSSTQSNVVYFGTEEDDLEILYMGPAIETLSNSELGGMLQQTVTYYYKIDAQNAHGTTTTGVKSFTVEDNESIMTVGTGMSVLGGFPWEPQDRYSYTQSIYHDVEVARGDVITALSYFWTGYSLFSNHVQIYMGYTEDEFFWSTTSWVPEEDLTLVFDGIVNSVDSHTWLKIELDQAFVLEDDRHVVIAFIEDTNLHETNADNFRCTSTSTTRSLHYSSNSIVPSIAYPPVGEARYYLPNTKIHFLDTDRVSYLNDSFEENTSFDTEFTPWVTLDLDQDFTTTYEGSTFPNDGELKGFMVLNPFQVNPLVAGTNPHFGQKMAVSFPAQNGDTNDWLISPLLDTPQFYIGDLDSLDVKFYAKSHILEGESRAIMNLKYSDGSLDPNDFSFVPTHLTPILVDTNWTLFEAQVPIPETEQVRFAIQATTNGVAALYVDDVEMFISLEHVPNEEDTNPRIPNNLITSNYPNPFNPDTSISFTVPKAGNVKLTVFNILGQEIVELTNQNYLAGTHTVNWNGTDSNNQPVTSGIYFYKVSSGNQKATGKMVLMK